MYKREHDVHFRFIFLSCVSFKEEIRRKEKRRKKKEKEGIESVFFNIANKIGFLHYSSRLGGVFLIRDPFRVSFPR